MDVAIFATAGAALVAAAHVASSKRQAHSAALKEAAAAKAAALEAAATGARHTHAVLPGAEPGEVVIHPIDHIKRRFPDAATFESPLLHRTWPMNHNFVSEGEYTLTTQSFVASVAPGGGADASTSGRALRHSHSATSMDASGREGVLAATPSVVASPAVGASPSVSPAAAPASATAGAGVMGSAVGTAAPEARPKPVAFATAGPRPVLYHNPATTRIAIATCGGLCPGLNTIIREVVMCATYVYGVPQGNVFGVPGGYSGFYGDAAKWVALRPDVVSRIHTMGGTILGSSRGGMDPEKILDGIVAQRINIVILVGGDGTHRGAALLAETAERRGVQVSIACVPKTVDCDLPIIDRSFGFQTAVELGVRPITSAHTEAHSATRGVGLVKVMGRSAGFIALYASLASRDVNVCLLPEADWRLDKLCAFLEERLERSNHAVIVVAEGAESLEVREERERLAAAGMEPRVERDPSGNPVLPDVGEYLKAGIAAHFKRRGQVCNLKYIDPSYVLRAAPANAADSDLCAQLAFNCLHGAMGGYTGFTVGTVENVAVWLPVQLMATGKPRRVDIYSRIYARLISSTGQPDLS